MEVNNTLLNNQEITEEIKRKIKTYLETNKTQNLWDEAKAVLRGKFIGMNAYLKKKEKSQIINLTLYTSRNQKKNNKDQSQYKNEIRKIRAKVNRD